MYKLIEECMIFVNIVFVFLVEKVKEVVLYCVYELLGEECFIGFCDFFGELGFDFFGGFELLLIDYVNLMK